MIHATCVLSAALCRVLTVTTDTCNHLHRGALLERIFLRIK